MKTVIAATAASIALAGATVPLSAAATSATPAPLTAASSPAAAVSVVQALPNRLTDKQKRRVQATLRADRAQRADRVPPTMTGVYPSAYVGPKFDARYESKRKCIVRRESNGHYTAISSGGTYRGAYQMSIALGRGAAWEMKRPDLVTVSVHKWSRFEQDEAFWTIFDHGRGASHWAGGRWSC